jgi:DNA-binding NarL/FixJ family response regulator
MSTNLTCIAIDDDPVFLRKIEAFIEEIPELQLLESHSNAIKGATSVIKSAPDVLLTDIEMPYTDGFYLIDWLQPKLASMEKPPKIIVISSLWLKEEELPRDAAAFINKYDLKEPEILRRTVQGLFS